MGDRVQLRGAAGAPATRASGYDLVTMFDCLHDMGDPVGAAGHVREPLAADGTWMIVEPFAGDRVEDNLNPVGRIYYGFSTLLCTPASLSQDVGLALGAQAGEARIREVVAGRRLHPLPAGGGDAVQHRVRSQAISPATGRAGSLEPARSVVVSRISCSRRFDISCIPIYRYASVMFNVRSQYDCSTRT